MKTVLLTLLAILFVSCNSPEKKVEVVKTNHSTEQKNGVQIGQYVVEAFQDSQENLWFGTLEKGVALYDGKKLLYLTTDDGLPSNRVVSITEDKLGNLWFGTGAGLSKYDGKKFTNYSKEDGLCSDMISNLYIDSKGVFWIGTWGGVCQYDGTEFNDFTIPYPEIETQINPDTKNWITTITEDSKGNIWFGRDGYGASKFDGNSFTHLTKKEGLNSNNVQSIAEDHEGNIWIGTRVAEKDNAALEKRFGEGGLNKYDGKEVSLFPNIEGLNQSDVYTVHKDYSGDLWVGTLKNGVYKYVNGAFLNYEVPVPIMPILKDKKGSIWLGCAGGLYKIEKNEKVVNVKTTGPW